MNTRLYVGNLAFSATEAEIREVFSECGAVSEVAVVMDRETNRPRGFAFVTMADAAGMEAAMQKLNGKEWNGRVLTVNEARPREERPSFGGGGGGRGGFGGGGGGRGGDRGDRGGPRGGRSERY
ncbi:MAG: RNA-binding protein [Verrucomicrobiota bacterium]|nr:RNA-binding protein [Verrucomicrobiota bacterium]